MLFYAFNEGKPEEKDLQKIFRFFCTDLQIAYPV